MKYGLKIGALLGAALLSLLAGCGGADVGGETSAVEGRAQVVKAAAQNFTGNGTYWNPQQSGTGFVFEAQGDAGVVAFFVFDTNGKPVWYMASGAFSAENNGDYNFSGTLQRYSGGQPASSTVPKTPTATPVGAVSIKFSGDNASVQLPGRAYVAQRFNPSNQGSPATATQPETGIYWNAGQSGRGYTIEVRNNMMMVGVFHYDADGAPTWNLVVGPIGSQGSGNGDFNAYSGGQTLTGPYVAPQGPVSGGTLNATFTQPCKGFITLPGVPGIQVTRFPFGGLPAGEECRASKTAAQANYLTALKCANSFQASGSVIPNASMEVQSNGVSLTFKMPSSGSVDVRTCALSGSADIAVPAEVRALLGGSLRPSNAIVLADGEFGALVDKQIAFNVFFVGEPERAQQTHVVEFTQDAAGVWKKAVLPTTRTPVSFPGQPVNPAFPLIQFKAPVSKPGFYFAEFIQ